MIIRQFPPNKLQCSSLMDTTLPTLEKLMQRSADLHHHLCPRQVLGVRMGLLGGQWLDLPVPQVDKRLLTIAETDGCATDGIAVATNCWVGRRTMRILDFGKVAATFVDTETERAVRIAPSPQSRRLAKQYAPDAESRWHAYLLGYQRVPVADLFVVHPVRLSQPLAEILSKETHRAICDVCGEEVMNQREVVREGRVLCRPCAGEGYYCEG